MDFSNPKTTPHMMRRPVFQPNHAFVFSCHVHKTHFQRRRKQDISRVTKTKRSRMWTRGYLTLSSVNLFRPSTSLGILTND
ncbi:hypothetical protein M438DRAFT_151768 [Aureobasidium pullulans EXF-150]|uniref:Uncharacterized protein n=1 Tax=Aureobasidium pullulans EXF-150 TaxID=1043002 RepID=A0A074X1D3_AURPU|nr:uncharacterized protein M438DRAFT_151768 [Aureobasidium pullulans EXF-150]KEQ79198.1 hypothetical protein M438DRAFT_151768 [Aureobasidium pullulans EXF-150]